MAIFIYSLWVLLIYMMSIPSCIIYHVCNGTPFPTTIKQFIKLTFLPYVIYKIIRKEDL